MARKRVVTSDAHFHAGKPERRGQLKGARVNDDIARQIYALRVAAGLTQEALANLIGTNSTVISRLESAHYKGHSLTTLRRIAAALNARVQVRFVRLGRPA